MQELRAFRRRVEPHDAAVLLVVFAPDETVALHADDQARGGGGGDLLGLGERSDRDRAAEDHDRERGGARGREAHRLVLAAQPPQQADGGRMEPVGERALDGR